MNLYFIRILSLVVIALVYMLFDLFNKRNVPELFAYGTLAYGFLLTILYLNLNQIAISSAIALIVLGVGYIVYKIGQLGFADVIEFAAISLILPILKTPILSSLAPNQFGVQLPFILALIINTGIVALVIVPVYYLPKAKKMLKKSLFSFVTKKEIFTSALLAIVYITFILFTILLFGLNYIGIVILSLLLISSFLVMLFSVPITRSMVDYVPLKEFDEGDIIAFNLMDQKEIKKLKSEIKDFDRLVTSDLIKRMKEKKIKEKFPVYKKAMPFALPIFIALILSLLLGNLILFIL